MSKKNIGMKKELQSMLNSLAIICLSESEIHHEYTDEDLMNATIIFSHFFLDAVYTEQKDKLEFEQMVELSEALGESIRELILTATNKDTRLLAQALNDDEKSL